MKEFIKNIWKEKWNWGDILLFSIIIIYPFIVIPNSNGYFYFPRFIFLIIISLLSLPILFKYKENSMKKRYIFLLLFISFMLISSIQSYDIHTAFIGLYGIQAIVTDNIKCTFSFVNTARFTGFTTYICCIILYLLASYSKNIYNILKYMIYACTIISIIAIIQHFGLNFIPHESYRANFHAYGTFGQPNFLGTYTVFILPLSIYLTLKNKGFYWIILNIIIYTGLLVSLTRGVWISFFIALIILALYCVKHSNYKKRFIHIVISLFIITAIMLPTNNGIIYKRIIGIPKNITSGVLLEDDAGSGRIAIWKQTIKLIPKYWAFGIGPDNLIFAGVKSRGKIVDKAHNVYLEMLVTMGVFTLISYLLFLSTFLTKYKNEIGFIFSLMIFTYLLQGFFNIDTIMVMPLFWIVLGLSAANEKYNIE